MTTAIEQYHERARAAARTWAKERVGEGRESLRAYVARREAKGDTIEIVKDVYLSGPYMRAVLVVNGTRRRVWNAFGTWRYA